jgi:hypothetical protein
MGLQSFENGLERMVSGVFSRGSRASLKPVELGRRLVREIDEHRSVDVNGRRIVPNVFTVFISPRDHVNFAEIEEALSAELVETIREYASSEGYEFMGDVKVTFSIDNEMRPGRCEVNSTLRETRGARGTGSLVLPSGGRVVLGPEPTSIGRMPENSLPLADTNVSRRHCEVRATPRGFIVYDVGSTNGTKVNGLRITGEHTLVDGDILSVGSTHLRFEAS